MILRFETARNKMNGSRKYFAFDTDKKVFCCSCRSMIYDGVQVKTTDFNNIKAAVVAAGYTETASF